MIGARVPSGRLRTANAALVSGMAISAVMVGILGGWPGRLLAVAQLAAAAGLLGSHFGVHWRAVAALVCVPAPLAALRDWAASTPLGCNCMRLPKPATGVLGLTGLLVLTDLLVAALAIGSARSGGTAMT